MQNKIMEIKDLFIPYEEAIELKGLGYDQDCLAWYLIENYNRGGIVSPILGSFSSDWNKHNDRISAILYDQAFHFFRKNYNYHGSIYRMNNSWCSQIYDVYINRYMNGHKLFSSYQEARLGCLKELIKLVKDGL